MPRPQIHHLEPTAANLLRRSSLMLFMCILLAGRTAAHHEETDREAVRKSAQAMQSDHAVVLLYHHVSTDTPDSTSVTPTVFAAHLDYIATEGFQVLPLPELTAALQQGRPVPDNAVAITFDDAYPSVFSHALPLLEARGWPFTIFVQTDPLQQDSSVHMSWQQLLTAHAAGATIAPHSASHPHMTRRVGGETAATWRARVAAEIDASRAAVALHIGQTPQLFAFPYGEYDSELAALLRERGMVGFGQHSGAIGHGSDFGALPRFAMSTHYAGMDRLATALHSRPLYASAVPPAPMQLSADADAADSSVLLSIPAGDYDAKRMACYATGRGAMLMQWSQPATVRITPRQALSPGRSRYNCTIPAREPGVYYWWSYLLMKPNGDGSVYDW